MEPYPLVVDEPKVPIEVDGATNGAGAGAEKFIANGSSVTATGAAGEGVNDGDGAEYPPDAGAGAKAAGAGAL